MHPWNILSRRERDRTQYKKPLPPISRTQVPRTSRLRSAMAHIIEASERSSSQASIEEKPDVEKARTFSSQ